MTNISVVLINKDGLTKHCVGKLPRFVAPQLPQIPQMLSPVVLEKSSYGAGVLV